MIRRTLLPFVATVAALAALSSAAPRALSAQVGYPPEQSPFLDLRGRQGLTFGAGLLNTGNDPAGVGPGSGFLATARYEYLLAGPLWGIARVSYAPGLERTIKDPETPGAGRVVGTATEPLMIGELGFSMNLTGNKSWRGIAPRVSATLGMASTFKSAYDLGGYRFGSKFVVSYGVGARYATKSGWDINADLVRLYWKMKYPESYGGDGSVDDDSILGRDRLGPYSGNLALSVGVTRYFFR